MSFNFPQLPDLRTRTRALLAAQIAGADTTLRYSALGVLSDVMSGEDYSEYRSAVWLSKQLFVGSAEAPYLDYRLAPYGLQRQQATFASGNAIFTGTAGLVIPIGTPVQTSDGTQSYTTQAAATIGSGGTVTVAILAATAGSAGNLSPNAILQLGTAISGVQPTLQVDGNGLTGGTDQETDAAFAARGILRIQQPPQGGAATDYLQWTKDLYAGVTRAWVYPLNRGAGTVDVYFMMDGRTNPIPLSGDVAAVLAAINNVRPVTANVEVFAPTASSVNITVTGMVPNTSTIQAQVQAQLLALMATIGPGGATIGDGVSASGTAPGPGGYLYASQIEAVIQAGGAVHFDLTAPGDLTFASGVVPQLGTLTFV